MRKTSEPEVMKRPGKGESLPQKLYRTNKKFRQEWDEFTEALETGKRVGFRAGLIEGARRERSALRRFITTQPGYAFIPVRNWLSARSKPAKRKGGQG